MLGEKHSSTHDLRESTSTFQFLPSEVSWKRLYGFLSWFYRLIRSYHHPPIFGQGLVWNQPQLRERKNMKLLHPRNSDYFQSKFKLSLNNIRDFNRKNKKRSGKLLKIYYNFTFPILLLDGYIPFTPTISETCFSMKGRATSRNSRQSLRARPETVSLSARPTTSTALRTKDIVRKRAMKASIFDHVQK